MPAREPSDTERERAAGGGRSAAPRPHDKQPRRTSQPTAGKQRPGRDVVRYERHDAAALVTIARRERRNAVDGPTAEALHDAFRRFESDPAARVLVLAGDGPEAFCAGADLKALDSFAGRLQSAGGPLGFTRLQATKPTIAAISGYCLAGGLELALWCDLRVAAASSTFGLPERRFGVPLIDGGTQRLPRIVGLGRALEMILTGRLVSAREALTNGLVTEVVGDGMHIARSLELARQLAGHPQGALLADRRSVLAGVGQSLRDGLQQEALGGPETFAEALAGGQRFSTGEGRAGAGVAGGGSPDAATGRVSE